MPKKDETGNENLLSKQEKTKNSMEELKKIKIGTEISSISPENQSTSNKMSKRASNHITNAQKQENKDASTSINSSDQNQHSLKHEYIKDKPKEDSLEENVSMRSKRKIRKPFWLEEPEHQISKSKNDSIFVELKNNTSSQMKKISNNEKQQIDEDESYDSNIVRCICNSTIDEGKMVQCDFCKTWQHTCCLHIKTLHENDEHMCWDCRYSKSIKNSKDKYYLEWLAKKELKLLKDHAKNKCQSIKYVADIFDRTRVLKDFLPKINHVVDMLIQNTEALSGKESFSEPSTSEVTSLTSIRKFHTVFFLDILVSKVFLEHGHCDFLTKSDIKMLNKNAPNSNALFGKHQR
ncbi:c2H2-type domain-containing protein [Caerostris extrusa]|uniref:C2H2-type domain-containing protein n=1 Tax=Caerostris extrusa TaxID=172846 RepID=A0AAV4XN37_CAEEX|nr:c2H2-type domain-containing protein [Caerostris extrusa]